MLNKSERLQNQIEQHVSRLEKLKSQLATAEKRLSGLEQVRFSSTNKQNRLADIEVIEQKLEQVLKISQEALKELQVVKIQLQETENNFRQNRFDQTLNRED